MRRAPTRGLIAQLRDDWDPDRLFEAERAINDLETTPGWQVITEILTSASEAAMHRLLGPIVSQAEYAQRTGILIGLDQPFEIVEAVKTAAREQRVRLERKYAGES